MSNKNNLPIITDENEKEYWIEYEKTKSPKIKEALIIKYKPLIEYAANRTYIKIKYRINITLEDLLSYGYNGLIEAIEIYNPNEDIKFKSFALWRMLVSIMDEVQKIKTPPKDIQNLINIIINQNEEEE